MNEANTLPTTSDVKTIAMANARKWESLSATEVCAGNPAIAEYVASLESRLAQSKKLYDVTLGNEMDWMRKWEECCKVRDSWCKEYTKARDALKIIFMATDPYADGAPDATPHDKLCNEIASLARMWANVDSENVSDQATASEKLSTP